MVASFDILVLFFCLDTNFFNCVRINSKEKRCYQFQVLKMIAVRWIVFWIPKHMLAYMYHRDLCNGANGMELQVQIYW